MKGLFVHDFKYISYDGKIYGDGQFEYNHLWKQRYLKHFSTLTIIARGSETTQKKDVAGKVRLDGERVKFIKTESQKSIKRLINLKSVSNIIKKEIQNSDAVIVRLPSIQGLLACYHLEKNHVPYIIEVVGSSFESLWYHDRLKGKIVAPILQYFTRKHIIRAPNVIYVTNNYLQRQYPNGYNTLACSDVLIDDSEPEILEKRIEKINKYTKNTTYKLGLVGSLDVKYKGHDTAIKAVARLPKNIKYELHFLGNGNRNQWIKMAKKYGIDNKLYFDTPVSAGVEMYEWLDQIDILLIPSLTEGLPRIMLECMSRAGIIVSTNAGDMPFNLSNSMIIKKGDSNRLSCIISTTIFDKSKQEKIARFNYGESKKYSRAQLSAKRAKFIDDAFKGVR